jgi:spore coat polysaccharide biosynthesis protein SpsF
MKVGFIITARMKSTRLPKKLSLQIQNRKIVSWMIERAKLAFDPAHIVIATSTNRQDDELETIANEEGIKVYRGHEDDVILRLYEAAQQYQLDFFINITADCPLFGYDYTDAITSLFQQSNADFITSLDLPHGIFVYGVKTASIEKVIELKKTVQTEVWGTYYSDNPAIFNVQRLVVPEEKKRPDFRLTIDYPEDYRFFQAVFEGLGEQTYKTSSDAIVEFLDQHPEIVSINKDCKALYQERWEKQKASTLEKK